MSTSASMFVFVVRLRTSTGLAAAHFVEAHQHQLAESGMHQFVKEGRVVWQGSSEAVLQVVQCEHAKDAQAWHRANLGVLVEAAVAYGTGSTTGSTCPFVGDVRVLVNRS